MEKKAKKDTPADVLLLRKHHKKAYMYLSEALSMDEQNKDDAEHYEATLKLYEKGILLLEHSISMKLEGEGPDYDRGRDLQVKMKTNLSDAHERVQDLNTLLESIKFDQKKTEDSSEIKINKNKVDPPETRKPYKDISNNKNKNIKIPKTPLQVKQTIASTKRTVSSKPVATKVSKPKIADKKDLIQEHQTKVSKLKNIDSKHAHVILNEVVQGCGISFNDVGGMVKAKKTIHEIVILPAMRPELFVGLRTPVRGLLLFGPPGNGKTMLASAVATEAKSVFFNISAAVLTSKFIGEGEKMVRALFAVARELQPAVIFIDEVDSLLSERKENEHEASRRMKTEFLLAFEGLLSEPNERILLMGATNRPWELDDAALRRFTKRVYIPMPDHEARKEIIKFYVSKQPNAIMSEKDFDEVARSTEGYSGSDLRNLAQDAALVPIRELTPSELKDIPADQLRSMSVGDFKKSLEVIRPSVSTSHLSKFQQWDKEFGSR